MVIVRTCNRRRVGGFSVISCEILNVLVNIQRSGEFAYIIYLSRHRQFNSAIGRPYCEIEFSIRNSIQRLDYCPDHPVYNRFLLLFVWSRGFNCSAYYIIIIMGSNGKQDRDWSSPRIGNGGVDWHGLFESEEEELRGQAEIWKHTFAFVDSLAVKCAVLLGIPDMIAAEGPLSLSQIAARLRLRSARAQEFDGPDVDVVCLFRILRLLAAKNVFSASTHVNADGEKETIYGLTAASKWLVKDRMSPMLLMQNDPTSVAPWHRFNECVLNGGIAFERAHGTDIWSYASTHPRYNKLFNQAMACNAKIVMEAVLSKYLPAFQNLRSVVDVGGGTGTAVAEIVRALPHIRAINFDLPHVVATAPDLPGVEHIGGDMFANVPSAEAVFMKWIMHDWNDENCIKILKNCRKAIPENGKIIIVDVVIEEDNDEKKKDMMSEIRLVFDLVMIAHSSGGKERTEAEWCNILSGGGFHRYNIIQLPALQSIIEAFPY